MSFRGGDYFTGEIFNRIGGRLTPPQILPYLNESLGIITAAGSFKWDQAILLSATGPNVISLAGTLDAGKKVVILNTLTQTPVSIVPQEEYSLSAMGYTDIQGSEYNSFKISYSALGATIQCFPQTLVQIVDVYYNLLPPSLAITASPTVRWDVPFVDSALLDMTEAACKRILSWTGWQDREASARSKLMEVVRIYSTDRINTGTAQETANAVQEKTQIGRA